MVADGACGWRDMSTDCDIRRELELEDEAATLALGRALGRGLEIGQGLGLIGDLGAGKTCLARGVAEGLGVIDPAEVCSPTYLLVMEHPGSKPMLHLDAYLEKKTRAFFLHGGEEYLAESGAVVVAEWADRIAEFMPEPSIWIELLPVAGGRRARLWGPRDPFRWIEKLSINP